MTTETELSPTDMSVNLLLVEMENMVNGTQLTSINILTIAISVMQLIEKNKEIKGAQKKAIVVKVFELYFAKHGGDTNVLALLPPFIDMAVSLDRGELTITITPEKLVACCYGIKPTKNKK